MIYEFHLKNKSTGQYARVLSCDLPTACTAAGWLLSDVNLEASHETYGKVLEKTDAPGSQSKTSDDIKLAPFCF